MSSTQFVEMYHPLIPLTITSPALVPMQAVDDRAAKGWLLVDPDGVLPTPDTPYYTKEALLSQIQGGADPIGTALRAALGAADPVLSNFSYDPATGNLLSYQEDGITITLTYNADGTVATSKRGSSATKTYSYSGGNLAGVA